MRIPSAVCALATMTLLCGPAWGGPAHSSTDPAVPDTLNIEFHWLDRDPTPEERAVMERAGKSWSRRIRAYPGADLPSFHGPVTLTQSGYYLRDGHRIQLTRYIEIGRDVRFDHIDGLLILIDDEWTRDVSTGQPHGWTLDPETGAFRPWIGVVRLAQGAIGDLRTATHEIGHILGLGTAPTYHRLVRAQGPGRAPSFVGAYAPAVHGGPVPLEHGHTAPCPSVMRYRNCAGEVPSELDFAFLQDLGYEILDASTTAEPEHFTYGARGESSERLTREPASTTSGIAPVRHGRRQRALGGLDHRRRYEHLPADYRTCPPHHPPR